VPRDARFNYHATDKHPLIAQLPPVFDSDRIHGQRLRTLLSVDDLVVAVHDELAAHDELRHSFIMFTSDNGFNLGQFRIRQNKVHVYDNTLRVPFLIRGPGISAGLDVSQLTQMADVLPTLLTLAGLNVPHHRIDGRSFAHLLDATTFASPARPWRSTHLTVYRPITWPKNCVADHGGPAVPSPALSATPSNGTPPDRSQLPWTHPYLHDDGPYPGYRVPGHMLPTCWPATDDDATNFHRSIIVKNSSHHTLYAEFTDITRWWDWSGIQFFELYDLLTDPLQLQNVFDMQANSVQMAWHAQLVSTYACRGSSGENACP